MPDKQNPNDPTYDWLYDGPSSEPDAGPGQPTEPSNDPEATQRLDLGAPPADDRTQLISSTPTEPPQAPTTRPLPVEHDGESQAGADHPAPGQSSAPTSFGGTYDAPPRPAPEQQAGPRFATPAGHETQQPPPGPPPAQQQQRPPRRPRRRNWWLRGILALILAWVVFLVAVPLWAFSQVSKVDAEPDGDRPDNTPGTTYLLVGSDSRADVDEGDRGDDGLAVGNAAGERTDTIIVLHVPDGDGPNLLLSLPRDSYVDIPGNGGNKINAAFAFGGPELLVETVEQNTGLRVDNYVEIGFTGFVDVVDAVGGIEVCPKDRIDDPKAGNLKMSPGCQDVDGRTALQYSRSRNFNDGDITRALHQREVISAVGSQAVSWQTVVLPWRYFKVNKAAADSLRTGEEVGPFDLTRFAWAMAHSSGQDAKRCVVPISTLGGGPGGSLQWDDERAQSLFDQIADDDTSAIECSESVR